MASSTLPDVRIGLIGPLTQTEGTEEGEGGIAPPPERDEQWDQIIDSLLRIRQLGDDWDGQGASAPEASNVDMALGWVRQMRRYPQAIPPSRAVPGVAGEVGLEWQGESIYLAAEISEPSRLEWLLALPGQPTKQWVTEGAIPYFVGEMG